MTQRSVIEAFCENPESVGSVTKTQGIIITAHAVYNHLVTKFSSLDGSQDQYLFAYQIKISVDADSADFEECQLVTRTWIIEKGDEIDRVDN